MSIEVRCDHCQSRFRVEARFAGKSGACPKCKNPLQVPESANGDVRKTSATNIPTAVVTDAAEIKRSAPAHAKPQNHSSAVKASPTRKEVADNLLKNLQGQIKRTRPTIAYRLGSLVVALFMILLPVLYIALTLLVAYGVYWHATENTSILEAKVRGRGYIFVLLAYGAPIFCGAVLVVFMVKPLFLRSSEDMRTRSLKREKEPLLFAFVDRICAIVNAPLPKRIDLDCRVNASASFRRGLLSMFGNDLVLTIGLPLMAGLNTRQFAGVLAHEFGHFAQGAGMRLTYIIRRISAWLTQVVDSRDSLDAWLHENAENADIRIGWVCYLAMLFVWLTRRILWVLMQAGNVVGSYLLRQMEFDADRYEARVAGSQAFDQTMRQLRYLSLAESAAFNDLNDFYREGKLGDNLPQLIFLRAEQIPEQLKQALEDAASQGSTGWLDTHPADRDRVANALRENATGIFHVELPASVLLEDFTAQSKATTVEFYRHIFGQRLDQSRLRPVAEIVSRREQSAAFAGALERFFQGFWTLATPLPVQGSFESKQEKPQEVLNSLRQARQEMLAEKDRIGDAFAALHTALDQLAEANFYRYCLRAKIKIDLPNTYLLENPRANIQQQIDSAEGKLAKSKLAIEGFQKLAAQRLLAAIRLLSVPQVAQRIPQAEEWKETVDKLVGCLRAVSDRMVTLEQLSRLFRPLETLIARISAGERSEALAAVAEGLLKDLYAPVSDIRAAWKRYDYPFDHADKQQTLAAYVMPEFPVKTDLATVYSCAGQLLNTGPQLYVRLLSELAAMAEAVETAVGLPKLPDPESNG